MAPLMEQAGTALDELSILFDPGAVGEALTEEPGQVGWEGKGKGARDWGQLARWQGRCTAGWCGGGGAGGRRGRAARGPAWVVSRRGAAAS